MQQFTRIRAVSDSGFFVLRTPLLPIDELLKFSEGLRAAEIWKAGADSAPIDVAWQHDLAVLRARLKAIVARPEVLQALFVASPSLVSSIENWQQDPDSKKGLQAERALVRYLARMSGRSTPFGLFAGYSVGKVSSDASKTGTELLLFPREQYRPCSRLDFDYLFALASSLCSDSQLKNEMKLLPNSSMHRMMDVYHYIESRIVDTVRTHHLVKIFSDQILEAVLNQAATGATVVELVEAVKLSSITSTNDSITETEAQAYVLELIANEILVPELSPLVTGEPPLDEIIAKLKSYSCAQRTADTLIWVRDEIAALDGKGLGASPGEYLTITSKLEALSMTPDIGRLYQVDMKKPGASLVLGKPVIDELLSGIEILARVGPIGEPNELREFREAFSARYEGACVPLLEALDQDAGVGFAQASMTDGSPLLRGLRFQSATAATQPTLSTVHTFLLQKVLDCSHAHSSLMILNPDELPVPNDATWSLPDSFAITATLIAPSTKAVREGQFEVLVNGGLGPSGATLFGRFCQADRDLDSCLRRHLRQEEIHQPDAVYAEVVYLPEGRIGNVLCRPVLRDYEIVYLGRSGAPHSRQLPASDLLLSIEKGRLALYSQRLGRRVIPRITNAHNFADPNLPPLYRFLGLMQHEGGVNLPRFSWGPLAKLDFLPRVKVGRFVLSCARWRLTSIELNTLRDRSRRECFESIQELRQRRGLPRWVVLVENDNLLPIDLQNALCVDALVHVLKRVNEAVLQEIYPRPDQLCVSSVEGRFYHELIVPFVRRQLAPEREEPPRVSAPNLGTSSPRITVNRAARTLPPGSDWLYVKLYGGVAALDDILITTVATVIQAAFESKSISQWFFIRYADPHEHLRLRFKCAPGRLAYDLMPLCASFNDLLTCGKLWKIQFDTYEREIERYGGIEGSLASEEIFFADSEAVLDVLRTLDGDEGLNIRWRVAMIGLDALLSDFGFDLQAKRATIARVLGTYEREFHVGKDFKKQLAHKFHSERQKLETLFAARSEGLDEEIQRALEKRSRRIVPISERLDSLSRSLRLHADTSELVASYLHMHVNRMIRADQRSHELVLYNFLFRLYNGDAARKRNDLA